MIWQWAATIAIVLFIVSFYLGAIKGNFNYYGDTRGWIECFEQWCGFGSLISLAAAAIAFIWEFASG